MSYSRRRRRGLLLAAALACMLIVMLFAAAVARSMVLQQRATRAEERQLQSFWLTESAAQRALVRSRTEPDYTGETWQVTGHDGGAAVTGVAEIQVEKDGQQRHIRLEVRWPDHETKRIVRHREFTIRVPAPGGPT